MALSSEFRSEGAPVTCCSASEVSVLTTQMSSETSPLRCQEKISNGSLLPDYSRYLHYNVVRPSCTCRSDDDDDDLRDRHLSITATATTFAVVSLSAGANLTDKGDSLCRSRLSSLCCRGVSLMSLSCVARATVVLILAMSCLGLSAARPFSEHEKQYKELQAKAVVSVHSLTSVFSVSCYDWYSYFLEPYRNCFFKCSIYLFSICIFFFFFFFLFTQQNFCFTFLIFLAHFVSVKVLVQGESGWGY